MEGIKVEKAHKLDNGNDTSSCLIKVIEHISVKPPLKKKEDTL